MFFFLTCADEKIGMGHMTRCVSVALRLKNKGCKILFFTNKTCLLPTCFDVININVNNDTEDVQCVLNIVNAQIDLFYNYNKILPTLVLDMKNWGDYEFNKISPNVIKVTFDDFLIKILNCDIIINYNVTVANTQSNLLYDSNKHKYLIGLKYVPLREQFMLKKKNYTKNKKERFRVLVCAGGGDYIDFFLDFLSEATCKYWFADAIFTIILGVFSDYSNMLYQLVDLYPNNIKVLYNIKNMSRIMQSVDLAVTAAGTVPYECCSVNLPAILFSVADDQLEDAKNFEKKYGMLYAGDIRDNEKNVIKKILDDIEMLYNSPQRLYEIKTNIGNDIDGYGAERLANALIRNREIGSFFETQNVEKHINFHSNNFFDWIDSIKRDKFVSYVNSGRSAIIAAIKDIEKNNQFDHKVCLLPIYTCDTVIYPFVEMGWTVHYYCIDTNLTINQEELQKAIYESNASILFLHSYYGIDIPTETRELINELRKNKKIQIIEDVTQSLFLIPKIIDKCDYIVCSIRKWFPIPDGGMIISNNTPIFDEDDMVSKKFVWLRQSAMKDKKLYLDGDNKIKKSDFLNMNSSAETLLNNNRNKIYKMSEFSVKTLKNIMIDSVYKNRNYNARYLYQGILKCSNIKNAVEYDQYCAPIYWPIYTSNRDKCQLFLKEYDIYAPILWPKSKYIYTYKDDKIKWLYTNLLAIPCDQRYGEKDMQHIIDVFLLYDKI